MSNFPTPLVSIIVPCYKVERYLPHCIESILAQQYPHWELILVDDGSPDRCGAICDDYARRDARIRAIHKPNGGPSSARNAGLDVMKGEYVTFLDSDDFWHPHYLNTLLALMHDHGADIAQCAYVRGTATTFPPSRRAAAVTCYTMQEAFVADAVKIIVWGKIYRAKFFEKVRMPEGYINEDDWTAWKLYYQAHRIVVTSEPLYYYTVNPHSIMGGARKKPDLRFIGAYDERIDFFRQTGERRLEACSHRQLCKALLLTYSRAPLPAAERRQVLARFRQSWQALRRADVTPRPLRALFAAFSLCPQLVARLVRLV